MLGWSWMDTEHQFYVHGRIWAYMGVCGRTWEYMRIHGHTCAFLWEYNAIGKSHFLWAYKKKWGCMMYSHVRPWYAHVHPVFTGELLCTYLQLTPNHGSLAQDSTVVRKISKRHFFQDIKNSFHGVTQIGLKPHQNFLNFFFQQIWSLEEFKVFAY